MNNVDKVKKYLDEKYNVVQEEEKEAEKPEEVEEEGSIPDKSDSIWRYPNGKPKMISKSGVWHVVDEKGVTIKTFSSKEGKDWQQQAVKFLKDMK